MKYNYKNKTVAILGLARSGVAAAKLLLEEGAHVYVSDAADNEILRERAKELVKLGAKVELGGHGDEMLGQIDEIIVSPGVPKDIPILLWFKSNRTELPIISEIELAYRFAKGKIIGITGSNGKSTTVSMVGALFEAAGYETNVVGNIGIAMSEIVLTASEDSVLCVELSSFQLDSIVDFHPDVACLLNLTPDHLDRHYDVETYYGAKFNIFRNQTNEDYAILNISDAKVASCGQSVNSKILWFSNSEIDRPGVFIREDKLFLRKPDGNEIEIMATKEINVPGSHNLANACAAVACSIPFGIPTEIIAKALREFQGLPHRLQLVGSLNGIRFINDSKATNVDSLECALRSFTEDVVLIAGGYDKGADFSPLRDLVRERVKHVVLIGATADRIAGEWSEATAIEKAADLEEAIYKAHTAAKSRGIVLLAPGCASYDMFDNFEHRGEQFTEIVLRLIGKMK